MPVGVVAGNTTETVCDDEEASPVSGAGSSLAIPLPTHGTEQVKFTAVSTDRVEEQHSDMQFSSKVAKGGTIELLENKYETSPENVTNQSSRFDISGNRVITEDLASSSTVFSTEKDSRMVPVSSFGRDVVKEMAVPTRDELVSPAQPATQSSSLSIEWVGGMGSLLLSLLPNNSA